jgi:hypothetical protein
MQKPPGSVSTTVTAKPAVRSDDNVVGKVKPAVTACAPGPVRSASASAAARFAELPEFTSARCLAPKRSPSSAAKAFRFARAGPNCPATKCSKPSVSTGPVHG